MGLYVIDDFDGLDLERALGEISPARREYALRYRRELDRKLSVAVYLLLKEGHGKEYGILGNPVLASGPKGKPYLPQHPDVHFSFSHCPKAAVCAISSHPVGVDVEAVAPVDWEVAERALSAEELKDVRESERPEVAFARYWTQKEALLKARGEGLDERRLPGLLSETRTERLETRMGAGYMISMAGIGL